MTRRDFAWCALAAFALSFAELIWMYGGQSIRPGASLEWTVPLVVGLIFFFVGWPLAERDNARRSGRQWNPQWVDRFLGRAPWLLGLGVMGFGIAIVGVACGFIADNGDFQRLTVIASWLALVGIMLGQAAILIGLASWFIRPRPRSGRVS